jgi:SpoIID/LytB domain protein
MGARVPVSMLASVCAAVAVLAGAATAAGDGSAEVAALVIRGHGFGPGIGLSQWGAEERAAAGQGYRRILAFYYPGTRLGRVAEQTVRVLVANAPSALVGSAAPLTVRDAAGRVAALPAGRYRVTAAGLAGRPFAFPLAVAPSSRPLTLGGTAYPGTFVVARGGGVQVVNRVRLETYLASVVSVENPGYWHGAALEAQAVASRTYALANVRPGRPFDLYADDRSQNYRGLARVFARTRRAVAATRGEVLLYGGALAQTFFTAANGGVTAVATGVWSDASAGAPYLVARPDPYDARGPETNWGPIVVPLDRLRRLFPGIPSDLASVEAVRNEGRRAVRVVFAGADGRSATVGGVEFQHRLGLRSTFVEFELRR